MSKRGGKKRQPNKTTYPKTTLIDVDLQMYYVNLITSLALSRFRWVNLPPMCDERYLEYALLHEGVATIAFPKNMLGNFLSLKAVQKSKPNLYDYPVQWEALGVNGTRFDCNNKNGVIVYDNATRFPILSGIEQYASELVDIRKTRRVARNTLKMPFVIKGPQEMRQAMVNLFKQVSNGEPALIVSNAMSEVDIDVLQTGANYDAEQLITDETNVWNRIYTMLGISNTTYKQERQTADEIQAQREPTSMITRSYLSERKRACDILNDRFEKYLKAPIDVVWYEDFESQNFNYINNLKMQAENDDAQDVEEDDENE